jgi:hypothetical protein
VFVRQKASHLLVIQELGQKLVRDFRLQVRRSKRLLGSITKSAVSPMQQRRSPFLSIPDWRRLP